MTVKALLALVVAAVLGGLGIVWSISTVLADPKPESSRLSSNYAAAKQGKVAESISVRATAEWPVLAVVRNQRGGIVTSVSITGTDEQKQGAELYRVNLRPVIGARGTVPAFRALSLGCSGPDVYQWQELLRDEGFYRGRLDGKFEVHTREATLKWQISKGVEPDGVVQLGDVIFTGDQPSHLRMKGTELEVGSSLTGGEPIFSVVSTSPLVSALVTREQASSIVEDTEVTVRGKGYNWKGFTGSPQDNGEGRYRVSLRSAADRTDAVCAPGCEILRQEADSPIRASIHIVPAIQGVVVPTSALKTTADGRVCVMTAEGRERYVEIVGSASGQSVVTGIPSGTRVVVGVKNGD